MRKTFWVLLLLVAATAVDAIVGNLDLVRAGDKNVVNIVVGLACGSIVLMLFIIWTYDRASKELLHVWPEEHLRLPAFLTFVAATLAIWFVLSQLIFLLEISSRGRVFVLILSFSFGLLISIFLMDAIKRGIQYLDEISEGMALNYFLRCLTFERRH